MHKIGRIFISLSIAVFTFIPPIADLATNTHVFNPGWTPHSRVHTVWLLGVTSSTGLVALYLLWFRKTETGFNLNLAVTMAACVYGSFFLSAVTAGFYGGALTDVNSGMNIRILGIDPNLFTFGVALLLLLIGWGMSNKEDAL